MFVKGMREIQNSRGESESPWKIPLVKYIWSVEMHPLVVGKWMFVFHVVSVDIKNCFVVLSILR